LEQFERVVDVNRSNYESYQDELAGLAGIHLMPYDSHEACNYQYVVLEVDSELAGIDRDQLQHILWAENVLARRYFYPGCHRMEPYRSSNIQNDFVLNETERLSERVLALPTGMSVKRQDIADVCAIIRLVVSHGREARRNLVHERENGA
jgi:dTDP-4-amino-4,6-dideoxygalactose transaminase